VSGDEVDRKEGEVEEKKNKRRRPVKAQGGQE